MASTEKPAENFEIALRYSEELDQALGEGSTRMYDWIKHIKADDISLIGRGNDMGIREDLIGFFGGLLQSIPGMLKGNKELFVIGGPTYMSIEPLEGNTIRFSVCASRESAEASGPPEEYEPNAIIQVDAFVEESIKVAEELYTHICEINSELVDEIAIRGLREDIDNAKAAYAEWS